jgi:hypothetical protein
MSATMPNEPTTQSHTGGCQCGAVRFKVTQLGRPSLCHCRMCQKAHGSIGGAYVVGYDLTLTRGALKHFRSSNKVRRGFCGDCGTPLTFEIDNGGTDISIAAFDRAAEIAPVIQYAPEDRLPWFDTLHTLRTRTADEEIKVAADYAGIHSHQHPDHDTEAWPPVTPNP